MPDKCLLCNERTVFNIKSHLTPAGITTNTFGERDKEHIYTIDAEEKNVEEYYGRNHPQEESTEIKQEPNSKKGIFCKKCEEDLGQYESAVQDKLNGIIDNIGRGAAINVSSANAKYVNIDIHSNILSVFFQSIIWRQCLQQTLEGKDNPLSRDQFEYLRALVVSNIAVPVKEIIKTDIIKTPKLSIFTSYKTKEIPTFVNPHVLDTNPLIFFIGPIVLLYWLDQNQTNDFDNKTQINLKLLDNFLTIDNARMGIVNEDRFEKIHNVVAKIMANRW
ncbi:MAG TPA: hypothetical protein VL053_13510 [Arachidicoccus sp.]|nr:hypothetical protein [Arachidicoccus sp.]